MCLVFVLQVAPKQWSDIFYKDLILPLGFRRGWCTSTELLCHHHL